MDFRKYLETNEQSVSQIEKFKKAHTKNLFGVCTSFISKRKKLENDAKKDIFNFGKLLSTRASYDEFNKVKTDLSRFLMKQGENKLETEVASILMDILTKIDKG